MQQKVYIEAPILSSIALNMLVTHLTQFLPLAPVRVFLSAVLVVLHLPELGRHQCQP